MKKLVCSSRWRFCIDFTLILISMIACCWLMTGWIYANTIHALWQEEEIIPPTTRGGQGNNGPFQDRSLDQITMDNALEVSTMRQRIEVCEREHSDLHAQFDALERFVRQNRERRMTRAETELESITFWLRGVTIAFVPTLLYIVWGAASRRLGRVRPFL